MPNMLHRTNFRGGGWRAKGVVPPPKVDGKSGGGTLLDCEKLGAMPTLAVGMLGMTAIPGYSVDSTCHNMLWLERFGGGGENGTIWGRFNLHCLFKQPKEKQSTGSRGTSVETERKLVEIVVQVVWTNSALMGAQ